MSATGSKRSLLEGVRSMEGLGVIAHLYWRHGTKRHKLERRPDGVWVRYLVAGTGLD